MELQEEEKKRKERASEKLKQLEQQIAARSAAEAAIKGGIGGKPKSFKDLSAKDEVRHMCIMQHTAMMPLMQACTWLCTNSVQCYMAHDSC